LKHKNHLGVRNEHLPTVHGFDEFFGNRNHLNTEEEPFLAALPKDEGFNRRYKPRCMSFHLVKKEEV
jgi:arylsulfatase A-like enzyme